MKYQDPNPEDFLRSQGWNYKSEGNQWVTACPFCEEPGTGHHFYLAKDKPLWNCFKCDRKGNLYQLQKELGLLDTVHHAGGVPSAKAEPPPPPISAQRLKEGAAALAQDSEVMAYLHRERGFSPRVVAGMGLMLEHRLGARWIGFPWRRGGEYHGIKWRILPADSKPDLPRFRREKGYESILYNQDVLTWTKDGKRLPAIILASGETDAVSLLSMGYKGVVATTIGEKPLPEKWVAQLKHLTKVYVLYDNDQVGADSARKVCQRLGTERAYIVRLPKGIKDANDMLRAHKTPQEAKAAMDEAIRVAQRPTIPTIHHAVDIVERIREGFARQHYTVSDFTPWLALNRHLATFSGLVVLTAPQNTGKTTFGLNIADHWARLGKPALFYCMEMTPEELVSKVIMAKYHVSLEHLKDAGAPVLARFEQDYQGRPLYVGYTPGNKRPAEIVELLRQAVTRYELRILFFDNLHVLGRTADARHEIGAFTLALKNLAMEMDIPVVCVAQPRKLEPGQIMTGWDLKESVDVLSDADQLIILHRQLIGSLKDTTVYEDEEENVMSPYTLVRIGKARFGGTKDVVLYLEGQHHYFRDLKPGEVVEYKGKRGGHRTAEGHAPDPQERVPDWVTEEEPAASYEQGWPAGKE